MKHIVLASLLLLMPAMLGAQQAKPTAPDTAQAQSADDDQPIVLVDENDKPVVIWDRKTDKITISKNVDPEDIIKHLLNRTVKSEEYEDKTDALLDKQQALLQEAKDVVQEMLAENDKLTKELKSCKAGSKVAGDQ